MDETGHERVVNTLMNLQASLREDQADEPIASVTRLPVTWASPDRYSMISERLDRVERELSRVSERLRQFERMGLAAGAMEPDLVRDLQRLVAERLQERNDGP